MVRKPTYKEAFWARVAKGPIRDCWLWSGVRMFRGKAIWRVAYTLTYGQPPEGTFVLSKCGNYDCVNPNHLYAGDHMDRMRQRRKVLDSPPRMR